MAKGEDPAAPNAEEIARRARERAERAGAIDAGHHGALTFAQRQLRDAAIVSARNAGQLRKDVAKTFGLTPRQITNVENSFRARRSVLEDRPMVIIEELMRAYQSQIARFAAVANAAAADGKMSIAVRALQGEADATERYTNLLADVGKLPDNLERFRSESEMTRIGEQMRDTILQLGAGDVTIGEAVERFDQLLLAPRLDYDAEGTTTSEAA